MKTSVAAPTDFELGLIDLLSRQGNVLDQLSQPDEPKSHRDMIDGAIQIISCFLDFSDKYYDDDNSLSIATEAIEIVEHATQVKLLFAQQGTWFQSWGKSTVDVQQSYELLGESIIAFCNKHFALCLKRCRPETAHVRFFTDGSDTFVRELRGRW